MTANRLPARRRQTKSDTGPPRKGRASRWSGQQGAILLEGKANPDSNNRQNDTATMLTALAAGGRPTWPRAEGPAHAFC